MNYYYHSDYSWKWLEAKHSPSSYSSASKMDEDRRARCC